MPCSFRFWSRSCSDISTSLIRKSWRYFISQSLSAQAVVCRMIQRVFQWRLGHQHGGQAAQQLLFNSGKFWILIIWTQIKNNPEGTSPHKIRGLICNCIAPPWIGAEFEIEKQIWRVTSEYLDWFDCVGTLYAAVRHYGASSIASVRVSITPACQSLTLLSCTYSLSPG